MMRVCSVCGEPLADDARFCPNDGTLVLNTGDPYIGQVFSGQFEIREICGRGTMGTVYRAWQTTMEREVAVKVLRPDLLQDSKVIKRFHREAKALARLSHPNIVVVHMVGNTDDGAPFLVMEYIKGEDLNAVCEAEGTLPMVRGIHITRQIASALSEAHGQNVVHRDLKPENIILCHKSQTPDYAKVLDFGIAKILHGNNESHLTQTGAIFGTPHYLSPEQAAGSDLDHRCDLYALGVILFRLLAGRLPFVGESGMGVLVQHIREQPPHPRDINPALPKSMDDLILKALQKDPADRFQSAEEMTGALEAVVKRLQTGSISLLPLPEADTPAAVEEALNGPEGTAETIAAPPTDGAEGPGEESADSAHDLSSIPGNPQQPMLLPERQQPPRGTFTMRLAQDLMGRRRFFVHLFWGLLSVAAGAGAGALYWQHETGKDIGERLNPRPPPAVQPHKAPAVPAQPKATPPKAVAPSPPAIQEKPSKAVDKKPPPAKVKRKKRRPKTRKKRPAPQPKKSPAPEPEVRESDHDHG